MQDGPTWVERQRAKTTEMAKAQPRAKVAQDDQAEAAKTGRSNAKSKPKGKGDSNDFVERWFRPILITCTILVLIEVAIIVYYA